MNRREFVKWLALIAAGAAASPEQIAAYTLYYEVNTPHVDRDLICVDEILIGGIAERSLPVTVDIYQGDEAQISFGMNLFGGTIRWVAAPDSKIVMPARDLSWRMTATSARDEELFEAWRQGATMPINGQISYIDQTGLRMRVRLRTPSGHLVTSATKAA